jgi:hypothetical protein
MIRSPKKRTMKPIQLPRLFSLLAASVIFSQSSAVAAEVRFDSIRSLDDLLPRKTEFYEIDPKVNLDGVYYQFKVTSGHGIYEVESIKNLLKVCHEIRVMEQYKATDEGREVWKGFSGSLKNLGTGAKAIVTNPNRARKAIGRSFSKAGRTIGRLFQGKKDDDAKSSTGQDRDEAAGGKYYGKTARILAYDLKLDVYTENPYAHELMHAAAKREAMGKIVISGAIMAIPVPGLYVTIYGALTPDSIDGQTEILIRDNLPSELRFQLNRNYIRNHALDKRKDAKQIAAFDKFLNNPNFSPREIAYIANHLERLKAAKNLPGAIAQLGAIDSVANAMFIAGQYELLNALNKRDRKITQLVPIGAKIGAVNEAGDFVMPSSFDVAGNSSELKTLRRQILKAKKSNRAASAKLYTIGAPDPQFVTASRKVGLTVIGNLLQRGEIAAPAAGAR